MPRFGPLMTLAGLLLGLTLATAQQPVPPNPPQAPTVQPEPPADPIDQAKKVLAEAKIPLDAPSLVSFLKAQSISPAEIERFTKLINQLGVDDFDVRQKASEELEIMAPRFIQPLTKAAVTTDAEVTRRCEMLLAKVDRNHVPRQIHAALLLMPTYPDPASINTIVELLPSIDGDDRLIDQAIDTLIKFQAKLAASHPRLLAGLKATSTSERLWCGLVLAKANEKSRLATRELWHDTDPVIRCRILLVHAEAGEREAIEPLIGELSKAPFSYASLTEDFLCRLLGDSPLPAPLTIDDAGRERCQVAWQDWWKTNGAKIDLKNLQGPAIRGITLISEMDLNAGFNKGRVFELGIDGKQLWELKLNSAVTDIQRLPNGRMLISEWVTHNVREVDREGKEYWNFKASGSPILGMRLPNGNTLIGTESNLVEIDRDGKSVGNYTAYTGIKHGIRLKNGNFLILSQDSLIEIEPGGVEKRRLKHQLGLSGWGAVELLPTGNYLLTDCVANAAVEIEPINAKVVRKFEGSNPRRTQRLPNGNTLVGLVSGKAIFEFDSTGKKIKEIPLSGGVYGLIRY